MFFSRHEKFLKTKFGENTENHGHIFFAIQPKRGGAFCVTRPAAAPASQGGFGWGTAPGNRSRYKPIDPIIAFPPPFVSPAIIIPPLAAVTPKSAHGCEHRIFFQWLRMSPDVSEFCFFGIHVSRRNIYFLRADNQQTFR